MDKIVVKFHDSEKELDLTTAEGQAKVKELAEKGYAYEEGQTKLKSVEAERQELKTIVDNWNNLVSAAKVDEKAKESLIAQLEANGVKLTKEQKDDDLLIDDQVKTKFDELQSQMTQLREQNTQLQNTVLSQVYDTQHAQFEAKYTKDNGYPSYDRKSVQEYADKNGIISFDTAYLEMNKDEIIKSQVAFQEAKKKKQTDKIKSVATEPVSTANPPQEQPQIHKRYNEATRQWKKDMEASGESLYK